MRTKIQNKTASAEIESLGAQLMSLKNAEGTEYLWQGDPAFWSSRAPVLFPTVGNVRGGTTIINGKPYALKRHGFAAIWSTRCWIPAQILLRIPSKTQRRQESYVRLSLNCGSLTG